MNSALHTQRLGRALPRSFVHAQRARTLRQAGKLVAFHHVSDSGRSVYVYVRQPDLVEVEHSRTPSWGAEPYTIEQARADFLALRAADARRLQEPL